MFTDGFVAFFVGIAVGMVIGIMVFAFLMVVRQSEERREHEDNRCG